MSMIKMIDLNLAGKRILIRADLNVPIKNGRILSDARICAVLPTIKLALQQKAKVMVTSHLGRPNEGEYNEKFSLSPIVNYLQDKLTIPVRLIKHYLYGSIEPLEGELLVLENVRFNSGETQNDDLLSQKYAAMCDVFVMDAFGSAHHAHASTYGIGKFVNIACAGPLLTTEINTLSTILENPDRPIVAIVGGSKVSTKLTILNSLAKIVDQLIVGGGIANTFIAAQGYNIGKSVYESKFIDEAKYLMNTYNVITPTDVYVAKKLSENITVNLKLVNYIDDDDQIFDLGDASINKIIEVLNNAKTILWNGPVGVFEFSNFRKGTEVIANVVANSKAFSVAGGGDTLAAINMFGIADKISYISTGGGAFLKFIEGKTLPSISILKEHAKNNLFNY